MVKVYFTNIGGRVIYSTREKKANRKPVDVWFREVKGRTYLTSFYMMLCEVLNNYADCSEFEVYTDNNTKICPRVPMFASPMLTDVYNDFARLMDGKRITVIKVGRGHYRLRKLREKESVYLSTNSISLRINDCDFLSMEKS